AASIDFATSNLRGAPFTLYCAGGKVEATVCMGPLAGTAVNATALSYDGTFDIGLFIDPVAVEDPADYRRCVEEAFADLIAVAAGPKATTEKPAKKAGKKSAKTKPKPKATATKVGSKPKPKSKAGSKPKAKKAAKKTAKKAASSGS
ncbi:MAG: WS/DGAT domain-containing protein, partial [Actinomycetota bacterium]